MDSRIKITIGCFIAAVTVFLGWISLADPIKGGNETFLVITKQTIGNKLPKCYGPKCVGSLYSLNIHIKNTKYIYGDAVLSYNGRLYHTHVWRVSVNDKWVWYFQGHYVWFKAMMWISKLHQSDTIGPVSIKELSKKPDICAVIGNAMLVDVTSDAGIVQQPIPVTNKVCGSPNDAGVSTCSLQTVNRYWPDGGVLSCGNKYYLTRVRFGGKWGGLTVGDGGLNTSDADKILPRYIDPRSWNHPDAALYHNCINVPIGAKCPK